jgi:uncharacterized membrane protein (DUF4010 family)
MVARAMISTPPLANFALLLGLSFFLGLAFEDFFSHAKTKRPGGIRTFPMLSVAGGILYLLDHEHFIPFTAGLLLLGLWLAIYYRIHIQEADEEGEPNVGLVVLVVNVQAYLLGAIALALPYWLAVGTTVTTVLLLASRERLHEFARRIEMREIITAGEFLILTGIILPLLPAEPVTSLTTITPRQVWLALVVVCGISYGSYLAQHYWRPAAAGLWTAALGGLYSSTATTIVLARRAKAKGTMQGQEAAGITLATGLMYLRLLVVIGVFNLDLAKHLVIALVALFLLSSLICALQLWWSGRQSSPEPVSPARNPLELGPAALFAALFVVTSLLSSWATARFGITGVYSLAAIVGITDIDPFVLNLAQGAAAGVPNAAIAPAILIAASSNNILKAGYAAAFSGGRLAVPGVIALTVLAVAGLAIAFRLVTNG